MDIATPDILRAFGARIQQAFSESRFKVSFFDVSVVVSSQDRSKKLMYDAANNLVYTELTNASDGAITRVNFVPHFCREFVVLGFAVVDMVTKKNLNGNVVPTFKAVRHRSCIHGCSFGSLRPCAVPKDITSYLPHCRHVPPTTLSLSPPIQINRAFGGGLQAIKSSEVAQHLGDDADFGSILERLVRARQHVASLYPQALEWVPLHFTTPGIPCPVLRSDVGGSEPIIAVVPREDASAYLRFTAHGEDEELVEVNGRPRGRDDMILSIPFRCIHHGPPPADADERAYNVTQGTAAARLGHGCQRSVRVYGKQGGTCAVIVSEGMHTNHCQTDASKNNRSLPSSVMQDMVSLRVFRSERSTSLDVWVHGCKQTELYKASVQADYDEVRAGRSPTWQRPGDVMPSRDTSPCARHGRTHLEHVITRPSTAVIPEALAGGGAGAGEGDEDGSSSSSTGEPSSCGSTSSVSATTRSALGLRHRYSCYPSRVPHDIANLITSRVAEISRGGHTAGELAVATMVHLERQGWAIIPDAQLQEQVCMRFSAMLMSPRQRTIASEFPGIGHTLVLDDTSGATSENRLKLFAMVGHHAGKDMPVPIAYALRAPQLHMEDSSDDPLAGHKTMCVAHYMREFARAVGRFPALTLVDRDFASINAALQVSVEDARACYTALPAATRRYRSCCGGDLDPPWAQQQAARTRRQHFLQNARMYEARGRISSSPHALQHCGIN